MREWTGNTFTVKVMGKYRESEGNYFVVMDRTFRLNVYTSGDGENREYMAGKPNFSLPVGLLLDYL